MMRIRFDMVGGMATESEFATNEEGIEALEQIKRSNTKDTMVMLTGKSATVINLRHLVRAYVMIEK